MTSPGKEKTYAANLAIKVRFFEAIRALVSRKQLKGVKSFAKQYELNQGNFFRLRHSDDSAIDAAYLTWLVSDFGIRAQWLLTGQGEMFAAVSSETV